MRLILLSALLWRGRPAAGPTVNIKFIVLFLGSNSDLPVPEKIFLLGSWKIQQWRTCLWAVSYLEPAKWG